ncbi:histone deacetylase and transcriptional regulator [Pichia californica]|uniref:Histone deacetylase and transcriptional regulator n=1 Tax=Pichia californica TaxID=460514 RepID=A0A9P7BGM2_9ASCO|nr:histone deacetylase and transcriptional regulator [[Candida] californica]KAG0690241.1 histone deacetylase and transcriptional regulator [[Candida] californica]
MQLPLQTQDQTQAQLQQMHQIQLQQIQQTQMQYQHQPQVPVQMHVQSSEIQQAPMYIPVQQQQQQQQEYQIQQNPVPQQQQQPVSQNSNVQHLTKRARRRMQLQSKLSKMDQQFIADKDVHYRDSLIQLQYKLSSLHSGENAEHMQKVRDLEEWRDYELLRLRLAEEYQVKFINDAFKQEYETIVENTKSIVDMVKTKLQEGLVNKIKQLKEDKALIDIVTSTKSVSMQTSSRSRSSLNDSSIIGNSGDRNSGYNTDGNNTNNENNNSGFDTNSSFFFSGERRSRRKRHQESSLHDSNQTNSNDDSYDSSTAPGGSSRKKSKTSNGNVSSATEDSNKILTENPVLNEFLYGSKSIVHKEKVNMKHPSKGTQHCPSLKPEEINEDLTFLRNFKKGKAN